MKVIKQEPSILKNLIKHNLIPKRFSNIESFNFFMI